MGKTAERFDVHEAVTNQIIEAMERGAKPWRNGWVGQGGAGFPLRANGEAYRGMNVLLLWCVAQDKGYRSPYWMTYRQAQELGGQVRKGEKSALVVKYGTFAKKDETGAPVVNDEGEPYGDCEQSPTGQREERRGYAKAYRVFNAEQIHGLPGEFHPTVKEIDTGARAIEAAETWFQGTGLRIETAACNPCYNIATDTIKMPPVAEFRSAEAFYSTLAHECVHATGAKKRLDRDMGAEQRKYAIEELVAEIGACFVMAEIGMAPDIEDSAAYLASWLKALQNDKRFIFAAAGEAQKAADWLRAAVASAADQKAAA